MHYAVFSGGRYYLYFALRSIFGGWILFVLCTTKNFRGWILFVKCTTQYFRGVDTICNMHYAVFSGGRYYLYHDLRSIFGGWILFILCTTQYFRGLYYLSYALRSIYGGWILFIPWPRQYFRGMDTINPSRYAVFSVSGYNLYHYLCSIFGGWIVFSYEQRSIFGRWTLFILCTTQYFLGVDTIYTMTYAVFSGGG